MEPFISNVIQDLLARNAYTPDFKDIRLHEHVLVFNYFKEFHPQRKGAQLLFPKESAYLGKAYTTMDKYVQYESMTPMDETRVVLHQHMPPPSNNSPLWQSHVKGDLYALTPEALLVMDRMVNHNFFFVREQKLVIPKEQTPSFKHSVRHSVRAFMYFGVEEHWENVSLRKSSVTKDHDLGKWVWQ